MIPLDKVLRPTWLFGSTVHEGCDRGGYYEQGEFAEEYGSPLCIVKLGCWGPVVQCNVGKRGWMGGIGGCPNVGGICIGCTMPGFARQIHAVYGPTSRLPFVFECSDDVWSGNSRTAQVHPGFAKQRTNLAPQACETKGLNSTRFWSADGIHGEHVSALQACQDPTMNINLAGLSPSEHAGEAIPPLQAEALLADLAAVFLNNSGRRSVPTRPPASVRPCLTLMPCTGPCWNRFRQWFSWPIWIAGLAKPTSVRKSKNRSDFHKKNGWRTRYVGITKSIPMISSGGAWKRLRCFSRASRCAQPIESWLETAESFGFSAMPR